MAHTTSYPNTLLGALSQSGFQLIQEAGAKLAEAHQRRMVYRTTLAELEALSDRDLRDLGFTRYNIRSVAQQTAYGDQ